LGAEARRRPRAASWRRVRCRWRPCSSLRFAPTGGTSGWRSRRLSPTPTRTVSSTATSTRGTCFSATTDAWRCWTSGWRTPSAGARSTAARRGTRRRSRRAARRRTSGPPTW